MKGFENRKLWLSGLVACALIAFAIVAFFPYWSWAVFDELGWTKMYDTGWRTARFVSWDYTMWGRIRPLSAFWNFSRLTVFGFDPHVLRIERFVEFGVLMTVIFAYLRRSARVSVLAAALAVAFALKAPPVLELLRYLTLSELHGTLFLVVSLLVRDRSRALSYLCLAVAVLTKEPFALFIALPALLDRRKLEGAVALAVSGAYLAFLYFNRRGGYYELAMSPTTSRELVFKLALDFAVLLPVAWFARGSLKRLPWLDRLRTPSPEWKALVLVGFSFVYGYLLTGKASGYTYHFVPSVVLTSLAIALVFDDLARSGGLPRAALVTAAVLACALPLRLVWNIGRLYTLQKPRYELTQAIRGSGVPGPLGLNCYLDAPSVGYVADRREEDESCYHDGESAEQCCKRATLYALLTECPNYDAHYESAHRAGLKLLAGGDGWFLFSCGHP